MNAPHCAWPAREMPDLTETMLDTPYSHLQIKLRPSSPLGLQKKRSYASLQPRHAWFMKASGVKLKCWSIQGWPDRFWGASRLEADLGGQ